jgi:hypothetical protein
MVQISGVKTTLLISNESLQSITKMAYLLNGRYQNIPNVQITFYHKSSVIPLIQ